MCVGCAEVPCAGAVRTARNIVKDFGSEVASSSGGLVELASCSTKNSERDTHRLLVNKLKLSLDIPKTFLCTKDPTLKVPVLRMRDWVAHLLKHNCWHVVTGLLSPDRRREEAILREYWRRFQKVSPSHPIFQLEREGKIVLGRTAPCVVHGDEGRGRKRKPCMCLNFHSLLGRGIKPAQELAKKNKVKKQYLKLKPNFVGHSFTHRFLLAALPKKFYTHKNEHVWEQVLSNISNDIVHMYTEGVPDQHGLQHWVMVLHVVGDWPFLAKSGLLARSFMNVQKRVNSQPGRDQGGVCHLCLAGTPPFPFEEIHTRHPKWLPTLHQESPFKSRPALLSIPHPAGQAASIWAYDLFHSFHLGVGRSFLGSCLALLSEREPAGGIDERFSLLSERYLSWCRANHVVTQVSRITKESIQWPTTTVYPTGAWHKGAVTTNLMSFFEDLCRTEDYSSEPLLLKASEAALAINSFLRSLYTNDLWIEPREAITLGELGMRFLRRYSECAALAYRQSRALFVLQPKLHVLHHCFIAMIQLGQQNISVQSPLALSVQPDEDFIGRPSRLSRRITARGCVIERLLDRYMQACFQE